MTAAFEQSAKALDSQVQFTVTPDARLSGAHQLAISGRAGATNFAFNRAVNVTRCRSRGSYRDAGPGHRRCGVGASPPTPC